MTKTLIFITLWMLNEYLLLFVTRYSCIRSETVGELTVLYNYQVLLLNGLNYFEKRLKGQNKTNDNKFYSWLQSLCFHLCFVMTSSKWSMTKKKTHKRVKNTHWHTTGCKTGGNRVLLPWKQCWMEDVILSWLMTDDSEEALRWNWLTISTWALLHPTLITHLSPRPFLSHNA